MKKLLIASMVMLFGAMSCQSDADANDKARTQKAESMTPSEIEFEVLEYDFGTVTEGEEVVYEYKFTNVGDNPLFIATATPSCGCTVPSVPQEPIAPGESDVIKVVFDSQGRVSDNVQKVININANTVPSKTRLVLTGKVVQG